MTADDGRYSSVGPDRPDPPPDEADVHPREKPGIGSRRLRGGHQRWTTRKRTPPGGPPRRRIPGGFPGGFPVVLPAGGGPPSAGMPPRSRKLSRNTHVFTGDRAYYEAYPHAVAPVWASMRTPQYSAMCSSCLLFLGYIKVH